MLSLRSIKRIFAVPEDPELVMAQANALSRHVPLMYGMVLINTLMLALTHLQTTPVALSVYVPALLCVAGVSRIIAWWRGRGGTQSIDQARRHIKQMLQVMPFLSLAFSLWTISLLPYGTPYQQGQVVFFCGITTLVCMFCLMHVRAAALATGALTLTPFIVVMMSMGDVELTAIALNLFIVVAVLLVVLLNYYRDFSALVASRTAMAQRQAETQRLAEATEQLANVDTLTGLPNHRWFDRHLADLLEASGSEEPALAIGRIDLDAFKTANETFGRGTGNQVLIEVARRLRALCPPGTFVARLRADNFLIIVQGPTSEQTLQGLGALLCEGLAKPVDLDEVHIHMSVSIGLAAARPGDTADMAFDRADYATSVAKRECRGGAVVFTERHEREISKVRRVEHELHVADLDKEISILFQRQYDIVQRRTTGYEVLARWHSPVLGAVSPVEFIPLAERTGMISKLTLTVVRKALAALPLIPENTRLSVNLSAHDIGSPAAIDGIVRLVEQAGSPCRIDFEITETAVMRDIKQAGDSLVRLLALGARIALDDFGTGHSSLTHVQKLPLDRIKIDRSFVADICNDPTSRAIVRTTTDLCRNLGISCVIEGVETNEQLKAIDALGGTVIQGYLFGRPVDEAGMLGELACEMTQRPAMARGAIGAR